MVQCVEDMMDKYLKVLLIDNFMRHLIGWLIILIVLGVFVLSSSCVTAGDNGPVGWHKRSRICQGEIVDFRTMESECEKIQGGYTLPSGTTK